MYATNNCVEDEKQRVENTVYFHGGLSSVQFQKVKKTLKYLIKIFVCDLERGLIVR